MFCNPTHRRPRTCCLCRTKYTWPQRRRIYRQGTGPPRSSRRTVCLTCTARSCYGSSMCHPTLTSRQGTIDSLQHQRTSTCCPRRTRGTMPSLLGCTCPVCTQQRYCFRHTAIPQHTLCTQTTARIPPGPKSENHPRMSSSTMRLGRSSSSYRCSPCTAPRRRRYTFPPRKESERCFRRNTTLAGTWSTCRVCFLSRRGCTCAYRRGGGDIRRRSYDIDKHKQKERGFFAHVVISSFCHISLTSVFQYYFPTYDPLSHSVHSSAPAAE